ncbi:MAG: hypothetical protein H0X39_02805 [Actinobacteria bacterium]|nr:hypothetical protein [Actinomycetota bacterium]
MALFLASPTATQASAATNVPAIIAHTMRRNHSGGICVASLPSFVIDEGYGGGRNNRHRDAGNQSFLGFAIFLNAEKIVFRVGTGISTPFGVF